MLRCFFTKVILIIILAKSRAEITLTLLHTNDFHDRVEETDGDGATCLSGDCYGGVARLATERRRLGGERTLLVDAGGQFQGSKWYSYYRGNSTAAIMNALQYDAMVLSNHEFDGGIDDLVNFIKIAQFPVISCNIDVSREPRLRDLVRRSVVLDIAGIKVGIVGATTTDTPSLIRPDYVTNLNFEDEITALQREVDRLTQDGVNIIIALTHVGFERDQEIARAVNDLDLVVGGKSQTFLYNGDPPSTEQPSGSYPEVIYTDSAVAVPIVQAYRYGKYLGNIQVTFDDDGRVTSYPGQPILLGPNVIQDSEIMTLVNTLQTPVDAALSVVIGQTLTNLDGERFSCRLNECTMGNLITDAIYVFTSRFNVKVAFWNGGSIRSSIAAGPVTLAAILTTLPYRNTVTVVEVQGRVIRRMLEHGVTTYNIVKPDGTFLQMSGLKVNYDVCRPVNQRVTGAWITCSGCSNPQTELVDDEVYRVALSDFLYYGGDGYGFIQQYTIRTFDIDNLASDVVTDYVRRMTPVTISVQGRISLGETSCLNAASNSETISITLLIILQFCLVFSQYL